MAISGKDRKILWATSGNRCAICRCELVRDNDNNSKFNIGEECHIISSQPNGPRHEPNLDDYDTSDNLILLCRNHHKTIDEPTNISLFPKEKLLEIKKNHEEWVKEQLSGSKVPENLYLITSGAELVSIISGIFEMEKRNDQVSTREEAEFLGSIWQTLSEYGDIYSKLEPCQQAIAEFELNEFLDEMSKKGFFIYANRYIIKKKYENGETSNWPVACIDIKYSKPSPK